MVLEISSHHLLEPPHGSLRTLMHPQAQLGSNILQLGCHAFADRPAVYREVARLVVGPTDVGETQKVEGLRFSLSSLLPSFSGVAPKLDQARFLRV